MILATLGVVVAIMAFILVTLQVNSAVDVEGFSQLCSQGSLAQVKAVLAAGANVNAEDQHGWMPLMRAAKANPDPEVVTALIKAGAIVNWEDDYGRTPLSLAAESNSNPKVMATLIQANAEVRAEFEKGGGPQPRPVVKRNPRVPKLMIEIGHGPFPIDEALLEAAANNTPEVVEVLIKAGANVNTRNPAVHNEDTPLMQAAAYNRHPEVITMLIKAGADVNARDNRGGTALNWASRSTRSSEVIAILVQAGAK
jgi:ankyrin repeat protein